MQKTNERIPISKEQKRAGDHMRLIVDRTEGNRVICEQEDGTNIELPVTCFKTRPQTALLWYGTAYWRCGSGSNCGKEAEAAVPVRPDEKEMIREDDSGIGYADLNMVMRIPLSDGSVPFPHTSADRQGYGSYWCLRIPADRWHTRSWLRSLMSCRR